MDLRSKGLRLVIVTVAMGCSSEQGGSGTQSPPPIQVVTRTDPASTADCPFGGVTVAAGPDDNGDGKLDDAEIRTRAPVCNDAPVQSPPPILVQLVAEPAGGNCAEGGTAVRSGPDRNANGQLDDDEVAHTDFVCIQPPPAVAVVTRQVVEPPGDRCAAGGIVFLAGPDRDGDGELGDSEIESTEISCSDRVESDFAIRSDTDVFALKDVRVITGALFVNGGNVTLPRLQQIGRALQVGVGSGATISLPALQSVGGEISLRESDVTALDCPQLRHIGGLTLLDSALHDLSGFPVLAEIAGDVEIGNSPGLVSATLPPVKIAGNLHIGFNPNLASAAWTVQDTLGNVDVRGNDRLATFRLAVVPASQPRSALGDVIISSIASLRLSASEVGSIELDGVLHDVAFDFGLFDKDVQIFANTSPFELTLSDPAQNGQTTFAGTLRIQGPLAALHTTDIVTVEGLLHMSGTQLRELAPIGTLRSLHALQLVNNPVLTLVAPIEVSGSLAVRNNSLLETLAFPRFGAQGEVFGDVVVTDNPVLTSAPALAALATVHGDLVLQSNPVLPSPFGPALVQVDGGLNIFGTAATELSLPNLARVGGFVNVFQNASLTTVAMPSLTIVAHELTIAQNPQLDSIEFSALTQAGSFFASDNPHLPACEVIALFDQVVTPAGHSQSGNDDDATCAR